MHTIDINSLTITNPPYLIYVCDLLGNQCQLVGIVNFGDPIPFSINLPSQFNSAPGVIVKFIDSLNCETTQIFYCDNVIPSSELLDAVLFDGGYLIVGDNIYLQFS